MASLSGTVEAPYSHEGIAKDQGIHHSPMTSRLSATEQFMSAKVARRVPSTIVSCITQCTPTRVGFMTQLMRRAPAQRAPPQPRAL